MSTQQSDPSRGHAQALVEFAMVLPLFLILLFAIIDFGRLEFTYMSLANAARETTRVAAVAAAGSNTVVDTFNNYAGLVLSPPSGTDTITFTVADRVCAETLTRQRVAGTPPAACPPGHTQPVPVVCALPLTYACAVPDRRQLSGGFVDVLVTNQFAFNPLFENRLTGIVDASFMQQWATLSTTARAYVE
ncbi:MAG TPA: TadE family protein [Chloroflexota bacterium]|nr:TadE family protein [Chloroflexota bacterium]